MENDEQFEALLEKNKDKVIVIDFTASWFDFYAFFLIERIISKKFLSQLELGDGNDHNSAQ